MTLGPRIGSCYYVWLTQIGFMCVTFYLIKNQSLCQLNPRFTYPNVRLLSTLGVIVPIFRESGSITSRVGRTGLVAGRIATWLVYNRSCWFSDLLNPNPQLEESSVYEWDL